MIAKTYIQKNLEILDRKYRNAKNQKEALFYSKLAIIELCGWIEESMDDIVFRCGNKNLREVSNKTYIRKKVIDETYGFEYKTHFRKMLIHLIGLINVERLEKRVNQTKLARLRSTLGNLKDVRNKQAHTHIKGVARSIDAPSLTLRQFQFVYEGLKEYEILIKKTKY